MCCFYHSGATLCGAANVANGLFLKLGRLGRAGGGCDGGNSFLHDPADEADVMDDAELVRVMLLLLPIVPCANTGGTVGGRLLDDAERFGACCA